MPNYGDAYYGVGGPNNSSREPLRSQPTIPTWPTESTQYYQHQQHQQYQQQQPQQYTLHVATAAAWSTASDSATQTPANSWSQVYSSGTTTSTTDAYWQANNCTVPLAATNLHEERNRLATAIMATQSQNQMFYQPTRQAVDYYFSRPTNAAQWRKETVTLHNHSQNSGFTRVTPTNSCSQAATLFPNEQSSSSIVQQQQQQQVPRVVLTPIISRSCDQQPEAIATNTAEGIPELDSTHFKPIKYTYFDGHTFDIPSELNPVDYRRSPDGSLYVDQVKYSRHIPCDDLAEDDLVGDSERHALFHSQRRGTAASSKSEFVVMFRVKDANDMACQTLNEKEVAAMLIEMEVEAKVLASVRQSKVYEIPEDEDQLFDDESEFDFGDDCCTAGVSVDIEEMDDWYRQISTDQCCVKNKLHRLWENCQFCGSSPVVVESMPADRLLLDELSAEGDEIMFDLQNLQSLEIGQWEQHDGDGEAEREGGSWQIAAADELEKPEEEQNQMDRSSSPVDIFYNVNMLITERLRPERARQFAEAAALRRNAATASNDRFVGGLWNNVDNVVWGLEVSPDDGNGGGGGGGVCGTDSMSSIFSSVSTAAAMVGIDSQSTSGLGGSLATFGSGWEHSNLVQIWNAVAEDKPSSYISPWEDSSTDTSMTTSVSSAASSVPDDSTEDPVSSSESKRGERKRRYSASILPDETREAMAELLRDLAIRKPNSLYGDEPAMTTIITCNFWTSTSINGNESVHIGGEHQPSSSSSVHVNPAPDGTSAAAILRDIAVRSTRPLTR